MKCSNCKKKVSSSARYCPYCQNELKKTVWSIQSIRIRIALWIIIIIVALGTTIVIFYFVYLNSTLRIENMLGNGNYSEAMSLANQKDHLEEEKNSCEK